jgi:hypothetical protein
MKIFIFRLLGEERTMVKCRFPLQLAKKPSSVGGEATSIFIHGRAAETGVSIYRKRARFMDVHALVTVNIY